MIFVFLLGGLLLLGIGGEALIRGAVAIGHRLDLPPILVGMVIVGFGTSIPELVVSVQAIVQGAPGMAVGNVIGSNISNILLILGVAALIQPITKPERALVPEGIVLVVISGMVILLGLQGTIPPLQGSLFLVLLAGLMAAEYARARSELRLKQIFTEPVPLPEEVPQRLYISLLLVFAGIGALILGGDLLVEGATQIARALGVSEGLIGLTIVAVGTSLPELASSIAAAWRGHVAVAYGNVIGSNLFNLLGILGVSSLAGTLTFPFVMAWLDGPVMVAVTVLMLVFISSGTGLSRREALAMIVCYVAYVTVRYIYAT